MTVDQKAQVANAREEQQMSNENDEQNQAEVAATSPTADDYVRATALAVGVDPDEAVAYRRATDRTQPAGEHHTGTLDLTGEGNAPEFTVEALHDEICRTYGAIWSPDNLAEILARHGWVQTGASRRMTLDAMRLIADTRRLVAEEIAAAFEPMLHNSPDGDAFEHTHPKWEGEPECPACWVQGIRQTLAREIGTKAQPADSPILNNAARVDQEIRNDGGAL